MILPKDIIVEPVVVINDQFFDLRGLSIYSSLGVSTLRTYIRKGWIPSFKVRGKILIRKSEFDTWLEKYRVNKRKDLASTVNEVLSQLKAKKQNKAKSA